MIARRFGLSIAAGAAALVLLAPAAAGAAGRFASPSGTSAAPCTLASPCDVLTAIKGSVTGEDITLEPGTYGPLAVTLYDEKKTLAIHGQAGQPRPVIISTSGIAIALGGFGSTLSDIELDNSIAFAIGVELFGVGGGIDRIISHTLAPGGRPCFVEFSATVTNSVCVGDAPESVALTLVGGGTDTVRNDTLEAPGGSGPSGGLGVEATASGGAHTIVSLSNTIAHGGRADLLAKADSNASSEASIAADHSNYQTEKTETSGGKVSVTLHGTATNQTAAPAFVNAGNDDFHEIAGSPTIAAGFNSPVNGTLDLDGNPRQFGGIADIGAYQFIPGPTCQAVSVSTPFGQSVAIQLQCVDALAAPIASYALVGAPTHGTASLNAATGALTYTPAPGYTGPDGFAFDATSSHGAGSAAAATISVGAPSGGPSVAPSDSQPVLSPTTFAALSSGASVIARAAKGTTITYADTQAARTTFLVRQAIGKGVLSHGKCAKPPGRGHSRGHRCTRFKSLGSFSHTDLAGSNRFRFTGRVGGRSLRPGSYQLVSTPTNSAGMSGKSHLNTFKIVSH